MSGLTIERDSAASYMDQYQEQAELLLKVGSCLGSVDPALRADEMEWRANLYRELDDLRHQIAMVEVMLESSSLAARTDQLADNYAEMFSRIDHSLQGHPVGPAASEVA